MAHIQIAGKYDVKEVAQNIDNFRFSTPITLLEFINLFENMNPKDYRRLVYQDVLDQVSEPIPDSIVDVLVSSQDLSYNDFIYNSTIMPTLIKKLITENEDNFDRTGMISTQTLTTAQFKALIANADYLDASELAEAITEANNTEFAKFVVKNWDEISALESEELSTFQYHLFVGLGSTILTDNDSRKLFGKVRPTMSSEELRDHDPCPEGWRRCMTWAGRSEVRYSWNEFIARHILSSTDAVDSAKSDLTWLAESVADSVDLFDQE